jgi:hypothetical protein
LILLSEKTDSFGMLLILSLKRSVSGGGSWDITFVSMTGAAGG